MELIPLLPGFFTVPPRISNRRGLSRRRLRSHTKEIYDGIRDHLPLSHYLSG